jgi:hypothetical protein
MVYAMTPMMLNSKKRLAMMPIRMSSRFSFPENAEKL